MMMISKIKLKERLFDYYTQNFYKLVVPINRSKLQGYLFLSVYFLQLLCITMTSTNFINNHANSQNDRIVLGKIQSILEYFMIYPIWNYSSGGQNLVVLSSELQFTIAIAIVNAVIISCIILQIIFFGFSPRIINITNKILMSIFIFYRYILIIPTMRASEQFLFSNSLFGSSSLTSMASSGNSTTTSTQNSNELIGAILSLFNAVSSLGFGLILVHHDFTYSFQTTTDKLARRKSIASKIIVLSDMWLAVLNDPYLTFTIQMVFALLDLYSFSTNMIFYDFDISRFYFQISSTRFLLHSLLLLSYQLSSTTDLSVVLILAVPLILQVSTYILRFLEYRLPHMSQVDFTNPQKGDMHLRSIIRSLINIQHASYLDTDSGVLFESILHRHMQVCTQRKDKIKNFQSFVSTTLNVERNDKSSNSSIICPCKDLNQILKEVDNIQASDVRRKLILLYLHETYLYSKNKYPDNLCATFYYLAYLVEVSESPVNALQRLIEYEILNSKNLSLHYQMILADLKAKAQTRFENSQKNRGSLKTNLLDGIKYDQWLQNLDINLIKCLKQLKSINYFMMSEMMNLDEFHSKCKHLLDEMTYLETYFKAIYDINPSSAQLQEHLSVYINIFDIRKYKLEGLIHNQNNNIFRFLNDLQTEIFSEKNCIIFVSFLQQLGTIKMVTKNSQLVVGRPPSQLKDQSINKIIPQFIARYHDSIIKNVIQNGYLEGPKYRHSYDPDYYHFFGIDNNNFIFPMICQMKIQIFDKCKDFGVTAFLKQPSAHTQQHEFILVDHKVTFKGRIYSIQNLTQGLYNTCFHKVFGDNSNKMSILDICKLIPLLEVLNGDDQDHFNVGTLMLYPLTINHCNIFKKNNKMLKNGNDIGWFFMFALASNCGLLDIDINLRVHRTQIGETYKEIEIVRFRKIIKPQEKIQTMSTLKRELSNKLQVSIKMNSPQLKKTFEIVDKSENSSAFNKIKAIVKESKLIDSNDEENFVDKSKIKQKQKIAIEDYTDTSSDEDSQNHVSNPKLLMMQSYQSIEPGSQTQQISFGQLQSQQKLESFKNGDHQNRDFNQMHSFSNRLSLQLLDKNHINLNKQHSTNQNTHPTSKEEIIVETIETIQHPDEEDSHVVKLKDMKQHLKENSQKFHQEIEDIEEGEKQQNKIGNSSEEQIESIDDEINEIQENQLMEEDKYSADEDRQEVTGKFSQKMSSKKIQSEQKFQENSLQKLENENYQKDNISQTYDNNQNIDNIPIKLNQTDNIIHTFQSLTHTSKKGMSSKNKNKQYQPESLKMNQQNDSLIGLDDPLAYENQFEEIPTFNTLISLENKQKKNNMSQSHQEIDKKKDEKTSTSSYKKTNSKNKTFHLPFHIDMNKVIKTNIVSLQNDQLKDKLKARKTLGHQINDFMNSSDEEYVQDDQEDKDSKSQKLEISKFSTFQFDRSELSPIKIKKKQYTNPQKLEKIITFVPESQHSLGRVSTGGIGLKNKIQESQRRISNSEIQNHQTMDKIKTFDPDNLDFQKNSQKIDHDNSSVFSDQFTTHNRQESKHSKYGNCEDDNIQQEESEQQEQIENHEINKSNTEKHFEMKMSDVKEEEEEEHDVEEQEGEEEQEDDEEEDEEFNEEDDQCDAEDQYNQFIQDNSQFDTVSEKDFYKEPDLQKQNSRASNKRYISIEQEKMRKQSVNLLFAVKKKTFGSKKTIESKSPFSNWTDTSTQGVKSNGKNTNQTEHQIKEDDHQNEIINSSEDQKSAGIELQNDEDEKRRSLVQQEANFLSSDHSRDNQTHKKRLAKLIFSKKKDQLYRRSNLMGKLIFLLLIFFTFFVFFSLLIYQNQIQNIIPILSYGPKLLYEISSVIMIKEFSEIKQYFSADTMKPDSDVILQKRMDNMLINIKESINDLELMAESESITQQINEQQIYTYNTTLDQLPLPEEIFIAFQKYYFNLWQYANDLNLESDNIMHKSSSILLNNTQNITQLTYDWAIDQSNSTMIYLQIGSYSTEFIALIIAIIIMPIYYQVQSVKQSILQLFATFSCEVLLLKNAKIDEILNYLSKQQSESNNNNNGGQSERQIKEEWQSISKLQMKKKSISRTNQLKQWNLGLIIICIICLGLSSIYPITNYLVTMNFIQEYKLIIDELLTFQNARANLIFGNSYTFMNLHARFEGYEFASFDYQLQMRDLILNNTEKRISELRNFEDDFSSYSRYKHADQEIITLNPLSQNTCNALQNIKSLSIYSESIFKIDFDLNECETIQSGILIQGSIIGLKQIMNILQELWSTLELNQKLTIQQFKDFFKIVDNQTKIVEFLKLTDLINLNFSTSSAYIKEISSNFFNYLTVLQTSLIMYALIQIIIFYVFGWMKFINHINQEIAIVKSFYSIISSDLIISNNYTYSYLKNYAKK